MNPVRIFVTTALVVSITAAVVVTYRTRSPAIMSQADLNKIADEAHSAYRAEHAQNLAARGRTVYHTVCIACHNADPRKPGTLGPEIWGSSQALITARVMRADYPLGYKPKRATHAMQPLPQVAKDIPALVAYLNSPSP